MRSAALFSLVLCGCFSHTIYRVDADCAARVAQLSDDEARSQTVAALKVKKHREVKLWASDVKRGLSRSGGALDFTTGRYNPMATAGVVMTWVGTAISAAGTAMFFATSSGPIRLAGAILAGTAEPIMLTGTGLWIGGLARPPDEVRK